MLRVRFGPFQPALERAFLEDLDAARSSDPCSPVAVVAPSRRMADRLQRLAALEGGRSLLGVQFHTFFSLAMELAQEGEGPSRRLVREPLFFDKTLDSLLGEKARVRGLAAAYRSSLKDLIDAGVEPGAIELVREGLLSDPDQARGLEELLVLLDRFQARLESSGVMPVSGLIRWAAEAACEPEALGKYRALFYYGFYDLTGLQTEFLSAVARSRPVTVFFPFRRGHPAFLFAQKFFDTKLHTGGVPPQELGPSGEGRALSGVLEALFEPGRKGCAEDGRLRLFNASGERDEAWRAAKEILRLVEEEGFAFGDIGIVARTLDAYRAPLAEALSEAQVPYFTTASEPLMRRPAARACLTLLTLARRDFPAVAVLDLVESPFFKGPRDPRWRAAVRRLRISRGWLQWEGKLGQASSADPALWDLLRKWKAALTPAGRRTWAGWVDHARRLIEESLDGAGDPAFEAALGALDALTELDSLPGVPDWSEFLEAAEEALARAALPAGEPNQGVRVLDAMEARGESFRVLFLLGLCEGAFPRVIREDPLLTDPARAALRETGGYWIAPKQSGHDEEKLLFHLLASSASDRLYCSYPRSDEEGKSRIPSVFLLELCRAAGVHLSDPAVNERVARQPLERLSAPRLRGALSPSEELTARALAGAGVGELAGERYLRVSERAGSLGRGGRPAAHDGVIGPPEEFLSSLRVRGLSPTALKSLACCPFQFFASRVLGLEEGEEPAESGELAPPVRGEIYHKILAGFYGRLEASKFLEGGEKPFPEGDFLAAEEEAFSAYGWRELGMYPLLWEILRGRMRENLRRFLLWDLSELRKLGTRPVLLEAPMRAKLDVPAPPGLEGLEFSGTLDRVDAGPSSFRVVDYKTRLGEEGLAKLALSGKNLQPPIYLELASRHPELMGLRPEGVHFFALEDAAPGDPVPAAAGYSLAEHQEAWPALAGGLSRLIETAARGEFVIRPEDGEHGYCRRCSFSRMCRKNHPLSAARARSAP